MMGTCPEDQEGPCWMETYAFDGNRTITRCPKIYLCETYRKLVVPIP